MAFSLFKSRNKNADKAQSAKEATLGSQVSLNNNNGRVNEKGAVQTSTPGSSVNNSMNSLQGGSTPSPEQQQANSRRGPQGPGTETPTSDLPVSPRD